MKDFTGDNRVGDRVERRRVGYYPDDHPRNPGAKDLWVILCTVPGARGPIEEIRTVTYSAWVQV